jgi:hypothetical protein
MRRTLLVLSAVGALAAVGVVLLIDRSGSCQILAERDLFDVMMDFDASGGKPTIEGAVEVAFAKAGMPRRLDLTDLDPIIPPHPEGNLIYLGVDGYWVVLATVQRGDGGAWGTPLATEDGFVPVERPRPCSILDRAG